MLSSVIPAGAVTAMEREAEALLTIPLASVAIVVNVDVPIAEGVPLIVQLLNDRPEGNEPVVSEQLSGAVPPLVLSAWEYACPDVPAGRGPEDVMLGIALTVIEKGVSTVFAPLVARMVKENDPAALSVPVSVQEVPVVPVMQVPLNPAGCVPLSLLQVTVPVKFAVSVWLTTCVVVQGPSEVGDTAGVLLEA